MKKVRSVKESHAFQNAGPPTITNQRVAGLPNNDFYIVIYPDIQSDSILGKAVKGIRGIPMLLL